MCDLIKKIQKIGFGHFPAFTCLRFVFSMTLFLELFLNDSMRL